MRNKRKWLRRAWATMTIASAIATAQGFLRYNAYILPVLILVVFLCILLDFIDGPFWHSFSLKYPDGRRILVGLIALVLIISELIAINENQVYVYFMQQKDAQARTGLEPTFSDAIYKVVFQFGTNRAPKDIKDLRGAVYFPFNLNGFIPFVLYVEGDKLYADVQLYRGPGKPSVKVIHNKIQKDNFPRGWDRNSDSNALEIVDEKYKPVFQLIYKSPSHILIMGKLYFPDGLLFISEKDMMTNPPPSECLNLKRIFRYPSSKYSGYRKGFLW